MSKKKASASTKDDTNQTITNFYRLRSGDPEETMSDNMTNPGELITPSQGMETSGRDERTVSPQMTNILSSASTGDAQMTISHQTLSETPVASNDTVVAMLNNMNKSLQDQMKELGQNLEKKLSRKYEESSRAITDKVSKLDTGIQSLEGKVEQNITELKDDFGAFNTKIEQVSSRVEEAENRISDLEDKAPMIEDNHAEIEILKAENASMKKVLQMDECTKRRNNFVINGLEGKDCKMKEAEMIFRDLCENKLKLGREWAQTVVINEIYRFPPPPPPPQGQKPQFLANVCVAQYTFEERRHISSRSQSQGHRHFSQK